MQLNDHYRLLLGLNEHWRVRDVKLDLAERRVDIYLEYAETLRRHLEHLLNYFECYITNAISEGFNSKIQAIKANARGFRKFVNYRTAILFFCGRLDMSPLPSSLFAPCH